MASDQKTMPDFSKMDAPALRLWVLENTQSGTLMPPSTVVRAFAMAILASLEELRENLHRIEDKLVQLEDPKWK